jgi:hypothetical protein
MSDSKEAAFLLEFLQGLPPPEDSHFDFMKEGLTKFAVLANVSIPMAREGFESIVRREAVRSCHTDYRERLWDRVFASVLNTYEAPEDFMRFMELSMYLLESLVVTLGTRLRSRSDWALTSVAEFHRKCFRRLEMS